MQQIRAHSRTSQQKNHQYKRKEQEGTKVVALCNRNGIPIVREEPKVKEGWVGKSKGLLQVLWERGFIDTSNLSRYTPTGRKKELGNIDMSMSLHHMMAMCPDFLNEPTGNKDVGDQLQY